MWPIECWHHDQRTNRTLLLQQRRKVRTRERHSNELSLLVQYASLTQAEKDRQYFFVHQSLFKYRKIPESLQQVIPEYFFLLDTGATVRVTQDERMLINVIMSSQLVLGISEHCRATAQGELFAMTLALKDGKWSTIHFRSGRRNNSSGSYIDKADCKCHPVWQARASVSCLR